MIPLGKLRELPAVTVVMLLVAMLSLPVLALINSYVEFRQEVVILLQWLVAVLVIGVAHSVEGMSMAEIGFRRPTWHDVGYLFGTAAVGLLVFIFITPVIQELGLPTQEGTAGVSTEAGLKIALMAAVTVGVVEELLYRGYAIEILLAYTNSATIAGGITWGVFVLIHAIAWPIGNLLPIALVSLVFILVYLRRRTLFPVVGAHALIWILPVLEQFFA